MMRVAINPPLVRWARERAGYTQEQLTERFAKLPEWESGQTNPTLRQLKSLARICYVPIGYFFLTEPPEESIPIPDYRHFSYGGGRRPSPNLLDTLHTCQDRQEWFRNYAFLSGYPQLAFVGSATVDTSPEYTAEEIRVKLNFQPHQRSECHTWADAMRQFVRQAEEIGVLVMVSDVVESNNHRVLEPEEFLGFTLSDSLAPLIFVNGRDTKAVQMFTLAHEIAHIWLGASALSNLSAYPKPGFRREEVWCNAVAAEILVPLDSLRVKLRVNESLSNALSRLSRLFRVNQLIILRRLLDAEWISRSRFNSEWNVKVKHLTNVSKRDKNRSKVYQKTLSRVGSRFAHALIVDTLAGQTLYRDAHRMLGIKKAAVFDNVAREIGVID